jgi:hypothetical protein
VERGHECRTVQEAGWAGKKNGELLILAEPTVNVLVTVDSNRRYQQNLAARKIAIVVLQSSSNRRIICDDTFQRAPRSSRKSSVEKSS